MIESDCRTDAFTRARKPIRDCDRGHWSAPREVAGLGRSNFDRVRPLWTVTLIDGFEGGGAAMLFDEVLAVAAW